MKSNIFVLSITCFLLLTAPVLAQQSNHKADSLRSLQENGWVYEKAPSIKDFSLDQGEIVYQITIDQLGKIEGIRLISCTVSKKTEKLYREETAKLTFKRVGTATEIPDKVTGTLTYHIIKH